jgi:hypothetical protein
MRITFATPVMQFSTSEGADMHAETTKSLLEVLNDAQNSLFDATNNLPACEANKQVAHSYNLIGQAIAVAEAADALGGTYSDAESAEQMASTLRKVWSGYRPGDKQWDPVDDTALNRALAGIPDLRDALRDMTIRAMEAEGKLREHTPSVR